MCTMLVCRSNMRRSCLEGSELAIWLVMEPAWGKAARLQGSFMRITFWAGRDHFGKEASYCVERHKWPAKWIFPCLITSSNVNLFRFSVSNDLKYDAERDLRDIGAKNIQVHSLNKVRSAGNKGSRTTVFASTSHIFYFSILVQIWENLIQTQWKCKERCDIRHLLLLDRREPVRWEVQDQIPAASPLVWGGLWWSGILLNTAEKN